MIGKEREKRVIAHTHTHTRTFRNQKQFGFARGDLNIKSFMAPSVSRLFYLGGAKTAMAGFFATLVYRPSFLRLETDGRTEAVYVYVRSAS